ncbi:unnamed protein product [Urochloa decumbens]|uniref:Uncharacterized protein n=1 Tax=Urochloa decumbens TaxID=240449 RepID=A0ABC9ACN8_9POAL
MENCGTSRVHPVDLDDLVASMKNELNLHCSLKGTIDKKKSRILISRVPKNIRDVDGKAYDPIVWSVGPYHNGMPALQVMEKEKWKCLSYILFLNRKISLQDYLEIIGETEGEARDCYREGLTMDSSEFIKMLLLDGCFLIASLHGLDGLAGTNLNIVGQIEQSELNEICTVHIKSEVGSSVGDTMKNGTKMESDGDPELELCQIISHPGGSLVHRTDDDENEGCQVEDCIDKAVNLYTTILVHDLFLLENQIPFFILKRIFKLLAGNGANPSLSERITGYVEVMLHCYPNAIAQCDRPKDFQHLLHLCHIYLRPSQRSPEVHTRESRHCCIIHRLFLGQNYVKLSSHAQHKENLILDKQSTYLHPNWKLNRWRRAVQYHEAGIKFNKKEYDKNKSHSLLDIRFSNGTTEIPCLIIDRNTESLFRNLIAFEHTSPQFGNDFTAYIAFLSQLMSTASDVTFLSKNGIIVHEMRFDEEVCALFSKLGKNVDFDHNGNNYLKNVNQAMEEHYQSRINRWMAWLWHNHFSNPWLILAAVAAVVVLICTILQLVFALLAYLEQSGSETSLSTNSMQSSISNNS